METEPMDCRSTNCETDFTNYDDINKSPVIRLWIFDDAPEKLKNLSEHFGDEDWVALVPECRDDDFSLFNTSTSYVSRKVLSDDDMKGCRGYILYISAHS